MQTIQRFRFLALAVALVGTPLLLAGCQPTTKPADGDHGHDHDAHEGHDQEGEDGHTHGAGHEGHDHSHGSTGPHGGLLIELGHNHKYHAEMIEEIGSKSVRLIILDVHLKEIAIDQPMLTVQINRGGGVQNFELLAEQAAQGQASRFSAQDTALFDALHQPDKVTGRLRVKIGGVSYVGSLAHTPH